MQVEEIIIGTPVIYWSVIKTDGTKIGGMATEITSSSWTLGHGEVVCKVKGKSGGVSIKHLEKI